MLSPAVPANIGTPPRHVSGSAPCSVPPDPSTRRGSSMQVIWSTTSPVDALPLTMSIERSTSPSVCVTLSSRHQSESCDAYELLTEYVCVVPPVGALSVTVVDSPPTVLARCARTIHRRWMHG